MEIVSHKWRCFRACARRDRIDVRPENRSRKPGERLDSAVEMSRSDLIRERNARLVHGEQDSATVARARRAFVRAFVEYVGYDEGERATAPISMKVLAAELAELGGNDIWKPSTAQKRFPGQVNEAWAELCAAAYEIYGARAPKTVEQWARRHWSGGGRPRELTFPADQFKERSDADLRQAVDTDSGVDVEYAAAGARELARRYRRTLQAHTSTVLTAGEVEQAARSAISLADALLERLHGEHLSRRVAIDCITVFDVAAAGCRILSRDHNSEARYLAKLQTLKIADLRITAGVRGRVDCILAQYFSAATGALLADGDVGERSGHQIAAITKVLADLTGVADKDRGELDDDAVRALVVRLASYGMAYLRERDTLTELAETARGLLPRAGDSNTDPDSLAYLRSEMLLMLSEAGLGGPHAVIPAPAALLGLTRYLGVGDILIARILVRMADHPRPGEAIVHSAGSRIDLLEPYLGPWAIPIDGAGDAPVMEDPATAEQRAGPRRNLLESARRYYQRAEHWLRLYGAPGVLRRHAQEERAALDDRLHGPQTSPAVDLDELTRQVEQVIVAAIVDLDGARPGEGGGSSTRLIGNLGRALLVLRDPYAASLGSDLAPAVITLDPRPDARFSARS